MVEDSVLQKALAGDQRALEELCEREWRAVYGVVYHAVQNRAEAQDLTQEVFARALRSLHKYQVTDAPFRAFLVTIAKNLLRDRWRRKTPVIAQLDEASPMPSPEPGPEPLVLRAIERETISRALESLPEDYEMVIRLRILEGMTSTETAALMSRSPEAVRQLQRRALGALRSALETELQA